MARVRDDDGNIVFGVRRRANIDTYVATYSNKQEGVKLLEFNSKTKNEAIAKRREWEAKYGIPRIGPPLKGKTTNRSNS